MLRAKLLWILPLYAACAVAAPLALSAAEPAAENQKILDKLDQMERSLKVRLDLIEQSLTATKNDLASLDQRLTQLKRDALVTEDRRFLQAQIEQLQRDLDALRGQVGSVRESMKPAPQSPSISRSIAVPEYGTLRVRNDYFAVMDVVVNGRSFTVLPGTESDILVPAGTFYYQVLGVDAVPRSKMMTGGRTHPIRIFPQS